MNGGTTLAAVFDWGFAWDYLPTLIRQGLFMTVQLTFIGTGIAMVVGLVLAVARRSRFALVYRPTGWFIEFVRSTPIVAQLFFVFFVFPNFGVTISAYLTGLIVLGLHYATYDSEVYRAGIEGVPAGQWEAARALNFSTAKTWIRVILPQAIPPVIPALGNYLISLFKDTPFVIVIGLTEIYGVAQGTCSSIFRCVEPLSLVGLVFFALSYPSALFVRWLERRYGRAIAE